jgi:Rps23 Pro-64 3,4-dihydroxylase Tpa1-like proline 4-hydroxylase
MSAIKPGRDNDPLFLDPTEALATGAKLKNEYTTAIPFPHIVLNDFLPNDMLDRVLDEFPSNTLAGATVFNEGYIGGKRKVEFNPTYLSSPYIRSLFFFFSSAPFVQFLEGMTDIKGLIPDPFFQGGGLHEIATGGKLGIHADFRIHRRLALQRRINVLIYLNKGWQPEWGGDLELWDRDMKTCVHRIEPLFNRCVVFNTDADSFHGHPDALNTPEGITRKSIALFYYTASQAVYDEIQDKTTNFRLRPDEDLQNVKQKAIVALRAGIRECIPPIMLKIRHKYDSGRY